MVKTYKQRIADRLLVRKLAGKGAVLLEGVKWCGKTTTAEQIARSVLYMSESDEDEATLVPDGIDCKRVVCLSKDGWRICSADRLPEGLSGEYELIY